MNRFSIIGLVLFAASAVISAFMPLKQFTDATCYNGTCKGNAATVSCIVDNDGTGSCITCLDDEHGGAPENYTTGVIDNCSRS